MLFITAIGIGFLSLYITNNLVRELSLEERKKIELWAEAIRQLSQIDSFSDTVQNFSIISEVIQNNTTVPVILTDENNNVLSYRNINPSEIDTEEETDKMLAKMMASKEPIVVELFDNVKNKVYYKDSTTLVQLTYYPYIQLLVIVLFIGVSYYTFSQSRKSEQNRVWVGMAKETAHQLGTPTSSLLAWKEILSESNLSPELVEEFGKDVTRLEKIVDRFSKIGSMPLLKPTNLIEVMDRTISYLRNRTSNKIIFKKLYDEREAVFVPLNDTLFEWVVENIAKNAVDAIETSGEVTFRIVDNIQVVYIDITDTGKGIPRSHYKTIFQPGFTTKERGWGLGLSLSDRIIENYHRGRIFVSHSELDIGTTFRIVLRKA
jgi:nitrogen-specific signal transduction histidine kinase